MLLSPVMCLSDAVENRPGQSRLTSGETERGPGLLVRGRGIRAGHGGQSHVFRLIRRVMEGRLETPGEARGEHRRTTVYWRWIST
ncbi:hypothetical protein F7725_020695 [Dissostichus mawsoni]|uniref:Uncharacterized protein n=1 Tax=Dissostichus mawsoni TaxID=36200 RepID=A0A7J5YGN3_DISMA|nr:hypothetical protein F7725_020695 [Dissostichus mawsoni]